MNITPLNIFRFFASTPFVFFNALAKALLALAFAITSASMTANANVIADRKAGFKESATSMKAIAAAIGSGNNEEVINQARNIFTWAQQIPSHFPDGSSDGDTKVRAEIWLDFGDFKRHAKANENAAEILINSAQYGNLKVMVMELKNLGRSSKACHIKYKD